MTGRVVSAVVAPPAEMGASLPKHLASNGAPKRASSSLMMFDTRAIVPSSAPLNAKRQKNLRTHRQKTKTCMDCQSPDRLCNTRVIKEKSFPAKRVKIILINEPLGL